MKRLIGTLALALSSVLVPAVAAFAQSTEYPPSPTPTPTVKGTVEHNPKGTAFTGADISLGVVILVALVVVGVVALVVSRRRAAAR